MSHEIEAAAVREMDGIDQLDQLFEKMNADVNELIEEEASSKINNEDGENSSTPDEMNNEYDSGRNFGFHEGDGQETEADELETSGTNVEKGNEDEGIEDQENQPLIVDEERLEICEEEFEAEILSEADVQEEVVSLSIDEVSVRDQDDLIDEQLRRLRFKDETTPFIRFSNCGLRHYKKQVGSFKGFDPRFTEFSKVDLPAHKAAWDGNLEALQQVFIWKHSTKNSGVPCVDRHGATPLHLAARRNQGAIIRWLMKYTDLSVMHPASHGETPVHVAAALGHADCVKTFLSSEEKDVKYILSYLQDRLGFTSLLLAIHKHQTTSAKILIDELGIRAVSAINDTGINSAHVAASAGNVEVLRILHSKHKKLLHQRAADGTTPVYFAAQEGRLQALQYLHDSANCDLMKASEDGLKPIHAACQTGHTSIVKYIISRLGNMAMKDPIVDGATPLHFAAAAGKVKTALWLLKNDNSKQLLNVADHHGDTPAHDAVESGHLDMVRILLEQGADLYAANKFGKTPYSLAMESVFPEVNEYIQEFVTRKAEEEDALLNQMSIFDMEGGEEVVNLEGDDGEETADEYPYETSEGPTPVPSKLFRDRLSVIARKPSLRLWPPMPVDNESDDEEDIDEDMQQGLLENIAEEDGESAEEENGESVEGGKSVEDGKTVEDGKSVESDNEEVNESKQEEETAKEDSEQEEMKIEDSPKQQTQTSISVVRVVSESYDELEEIEEENNSDENEKENNENIMINEEVENIEETDVEVKSVMRNDQHKEKNVKNDIEVYDKNEREEPTFLEVQLRKTVVAKKNRRASDPNHKGAGSELKQIFRLRKKQDTN